MWRLLGLGWVGCIRGVDAGVGAAVGERADLGVDGRPDRVDHHRMFPMTLFILVSMVVIVVGAFVLLKDARSDPDAGPEPVRHVDPYR